MIRDQSFDYNGNHYKFSVEDTDHSGNGSIKEIVTEDQYGLRHFVDMDGIILDVGANCGVATVILARQNPKARVIAFEPFAIAHQMLKNNIRDNNLEVVVFEAALTANRIGAGVLVCHHSVSGANALLADRAKFDKYQNTESFTQIVNFESVERLLSIFEIQRVSLLKIDCEGCEFDILENSRLLDITDNIVGEFHNLPYNEPPTGAQTLLAKVRERVKGIVNISILGG